MFSTMHLVLALAMVLGASAQVIFPGSCQEVTVEQNFDLARYLGLWYENQRYPLIYERNGACNFAIYSDNNNGTVGVFNSMYNVQSEIVDTISGYAVVNSDSGEGKLLVSFPSTGAYDADYWILDTDYDSYAVVWSCGDDGPLNQNFQSAWVLTRERFPSVATLAAAEAVLVANQVSLAEFRVTDQTLCPGDPGFTTTAP